MRNVTIDKSDFKEIVERNKKEHEEEFHEACHAFYEKFTQELAYVAGEVENGNMNYAEATKRLNQMDCPQGYCDQYQEVLDQLEYEVRESVSLTDQEFRHYVKDEWFWKEAFAASYRVNTGKTVEISKGSLSHL